MFNKTAKLLSIITILAILNGCVTIAKQVHEMNEVKPDEVLLIGKIEFEPPIDPKEIAVETIGLIKPKEADEVYRYFFIKNGSKPYNLRAEDVKDMSDTTLVYMEKDYYITAKKGADYYFLGGWFYTRIQGRFIETMTFGVGKGIKVDYPKDAKAAYVGTVKFKRDEFFNIKDIKVSQDDYTNVAKRFQKKFNTNLKLAKANLTQVN